MPKTTLVRLVLFSSKKIILPHVIKGSSQNAKTYFTHTRFNILFLESEADFAWYQLYFIFFILQNGTYLGACPWMIFP